MRPGGRRCSEAERWTISGVRQVLVAGALTIEVRMPSDQ